ncbi:MAG: hypothetical protein K6F77_00335 [Lachnospiraceae bacterium]|nr:hypothetical protein [Lachnospiraceae bacterium]
MNSLNKKQISLIAVYAIVFVVFNVVYFAVPFEKGGCAWVMYVFSLISIIVGLCVSFYAFNSGNSEDGLQSKVYGFPIFRVGIIYMVLQVCFSIILFVFGNFTHVATWIGVVISVILLGVAGIGVIATDNVRDIVESTEKAVKEKTIEMKRFKLNFEGIAPYATDVDLKRDLEKLAEKVKYSDPVSRDDLKDIEDELQVETNNLRLLVKEGNVEEARTKLTLVTNLLEDRNRRCKAGK